MNKINARDLSVILVENARDFLDEHHSQGALRKIGKSISLGLIDNTGELLAVAQFGTPRTTAMQKRYSCELYRLAFAKDIRIRGGASKLIKHYLKAYKPSDFFTYQDTAGEATAVYEHAGMTLVSQDRKKQYLVAPGKTLETGSRKQILGMPYATRFGPDRILGTKLGEVYRADGSRKSNKDIFIEELGWHIEETSGDRIYEWVDPNRTYYTYRITASNSKKYYYGVSHVKVANASIEDCLNDGYYGTGGSNKDNKFNNWKLRHRENLLKTVLGIFPMKAEAYLAEKDLIGSLWREDPSCLNSCPGGLNGGLGRALVRNATGLCPIHGEVKTIGNTCYKCTNQGSIVLRECSSHGITKHRGETCLKCEFQKTRVEKECPIHGMTLFQKNTCAMCTSQKSVSEKICVVHGLSKHRGDSCYKCNSEKRKNLNLCEIHGETVFLGGTCAKCASQSAVVERECPVHGVTKHRGNTCFRCRAVANSLR